MDTTIAHSGHMHRSPIHAQTAPTAAAPSLRARLDDLHARYVELINEAVAAGRDDDVAALAAGYDEAATDLVAEHEGKAVVRAAGAWRVADRV